MKEVVLENKKNGMSVLLLVLLLYAVATAGVVFSSIREIYWLMSVCITVLGIGWIPLLGLRVLKPQEALVLTLFGKYIGTLKDNGFYFVNPFCTSVNPEKKRLVLSAREILRDEARAEANRKRQEAMEQLKIGDVMEGTVESLKDYGAFIRLENGLSGLVHVSQISDKRVEVPAKVLKEGETVKVKLIAIKDGKLSLSMKALLEKSSEEHHNDRDYKLPKSENISTNLGSLLAKLDL